MKGIIKILLLLFFLTFTNCGQFLSDSETEDSLLGASSTSLGIDVSSYQKTINWEKVKAAGIKFAILRGTVRDGSMDSQFENNYKGAKANGINLAVYHFSYALSTNDAINACKNLIKKLNGKKLPIYLDLEWDQQGKLGKKKVTEIAKAFINQCKSSGYSCHIYSNKNWYKNYYNPSELKALGCKFWIASYGPDNGQMNTKYKPNVDEYIWQYTSKGTVSGINGNVDMNIMYGTAKPEGDIPTPVTPDPKPVVPSPVEKMVKVIVNSINRRTEASLTSTVVGYYYKGNTIQVVGKTSDGKWYVDESGRYFTASSQYVADLYGKVNCHSLNVRNQNSTNGSIITYVVNGDKLQILKSSNGWYYVKLGNGKKGWVSGSYVTLL